LRQKYLRYYLSVNKEIGYAVQGLTSARPHALPNCLVRGLT